MITIADLFKDLDKLNVMEIAAEAIDSTKEVMKDIQRDQLLHGVKGDGTKIGKYRNNKYARVKNAMNPLAGLGNVDLKLTGSLQTEIFIDVRERDFIIDSADSKTAGLIEKYGDPFGLTEENEGVYIDQSLEDAFVKIAENKLGL